MEWDLSAIDRFCKRVDNDVDKACVFSAQGISKNFYSEISKYYPDVITFLDDVKSSSNKYTAILKVIDEDLWFKEFGTGFDGNQSGYINDLPKRTLSFTSRGSSQSTSGWQYAYHPQTRKDGGWFYKDPVARQWVFTTGQPAQMGFAKSVNVFKFKGVPYLAEYIQMKLRGE